MIIDTAVAWVAIGVSLVNAGGVAMVYLQHLKTARNVVCTIRATKDGEIKIDDPFLLGK